MTWEWLALAGLALVALVSLVALARLRRRTARELEAARVEAAELRVRLDRLEHERRREEALTVREGPEFRITALGLEAPAPDGSAGTTDDEAPRLERAVFADHLLREGVIRLGSLAHGVRRALDAETRHRIRFEMRREVKRARKQRKADQRTALREWHSRQREELSEDDLRETA